MSTPQPKLEVVVSEPFSENTYIAQIQGRNDCIIIDPGFEPQKILDYLLGASLSPAAILLTHGHADHIAGNGAMKQRWPDCPLVVGAGDAAKLTDPELNLSAGFGLAVTSPPADVLVREGETYRAAGFDLEVLETPGHCKGHVVFLWKGAEPWLAFVGDVLFRQGIGRTDFADGDFAQLSDSIRSKLFALPDATIILPGHGASTTIGQEKQSNPFVGVPAGYRL